MTTWKEMPLGIKIISILLIIRFVFSIRTLADPTFFLGLFVQPPISIVLSIILSLIPLTMVLLLYKKIGWKIILGLQTFNLLNSSIGSIRLLLMPLSEIYALTGKEAPAVITQQVELLAKSFVLVPMLMGLVIGIIIWIYIFKKKDYFQN